MGVHRVEMARALLCDVDAELLAQLPDGAGVDARFGVAAGTEDVDVAAGAVAQEGFGERALLPVHANNTRSPRIPCGGDC